MKKITIFILIIMFLTTTSTFAIEQQKSDMRQKKVDILLASQTVMNNRIEIESLSDALRNKTRETKALIKTSLENKADLTPKQLRMFKEVLLDLKTNQDVLESTMGDIQNKQEALKQARYAKDLDLILSLYKEIIAIQNVRIHAFYKMIQTLNGIKNAL
ncbi:MAG: hypothetical protein H7X94_02480 [Vallitaleaceae bacterium]|nr:hypothetical protein [Vallitaleaceae bacterium]